MFNYCVWYSLNRNHSLSKLIKRLSQQLESEYFNGHITIASHRNYEEADHIYKYQCMLPKPWFHINGRVYQTETVIGRNRFYAIQQDYLMYDVKKLGDYHVSLAYRINKPFTKREIAYVNSLIPADVIWSTDINVSLNDCRLILPRNWIEMKKNVF